MSGEGFDGSELAEWDPGFVESARKVVAPIAKLWFRAAVRGLESLPSAGGALVVGNYSVGAMTPDVLAPPGATTPPPRSFSKALVSS